MATIPFKDVYRCGGGDGKQSHVGRSDRIFFFFTSFDREPVIWTHTHTHTYHHLLSLSNNKKGVCPHLFRPGTHRDPVRSEVTYLPRV